MFMHDIGNSITQIYDFVCGMYEKNLIEMLNVHNFFVSALESITWDLLSLVI